MAKKVIKNIADEIVNSNYLEVYRVVDSTYVLTETEEWVYDPQGVYILENYGRMDYIQYRTYLMNDCCNIDIWAIMTTEQRSFIVSHYQKPEEVSWEAIGVDDPTLNLYWIQVVLRENNSRRLRINEGLARVSWILTKPQAMDLWLTVRDYVYDYNMSDLPLLYYWFNNLNLVGTPFDFTTTGFSSKPYFSTELLNIINDILTR